MSVRGKWHVVETPGFDMGAIYGACDGEAVEFGWSGNNEMDQASSEGWAELQQDGSFQGEISLPNGDDIPFVARR